MDEFHLTMRRGNDRVATVRAYYPEAIPERGIAEGDPMPLSGRDMVFVAYRDSQDPEGSVLFVKRTGTGNGIVVRPHPQDNVAEVHITDADTVGLSDDATLYAEARVETSDNDHWTIAQGSLNVEMAWAEAGG